MNHCRQIALSFISLIFLTVEVHAQQLLQLLKVKFGDHVQFHDSSAYNEFYTLNVRQPVDHHDTSRGFFMQRVFIGHNDTNAMTVIMTHGYEAADVAFMMRHKNEVTGILGANQVFIEHRYFGTSIPDSTNLRYLTYEQSARDYHRIKIFLSEVYTHQWISVGISKGGQTALNYRFYFPNDVSASVLYVTPVINDIEDTRIQKFLAAKRTTFEGKKISDLQHHLLANKRKLLPIFEEMVRTPAAFEGMPGFTRRAEILDLESLYDLGVLEFDFNYWQHIGDYPTLQEQNRLDFERLRNNGLKFTGTLNARDSMCINLLSCVYWMIDSTIYTPFLYQAFTEAGFYGYSEQLFSTHLKRAEYSLQSLVNNPPFKRNYHIKFWRFLSSQLDNSIFIYGGDDPYTAAQPILSANHDNLIVINAGTNHNTRIRDLSVTDKQAISRKLSQWLDTVPVIIR